MRISCRASVHTCTYVSMSTALIPKVLQALFRIGCVGNKASFGHGFETSPIRSTEKVDRKPRRRHGRIKVDRFGIFFFIPIFILGHRLAFYCIVIIIWQTRLFDVSFSPHRGAVIAIKNVTRIRMDCALCPRCGLSIVRPLNVNGTARLNARMRGRKVICSRSPAGLLNYRIALE